MTGPPPSLADVEVIGGPWDGLTRRMSVLRPAVSILDPIPPNGPHTCTLYLLTHDHGRWRAIHPDRLTTKKERR